MGSLLGDQSVYLLILPRHPELKHQSCWLLSKTTPFQKIILREPVALYLLKVICIGTVKSLPRKTAGVLLRVRDASGTLFDSTFLKYQVSEQTRLRQITAEIFVHDGLDSAINIDRESFNYSHPHFLYIQRWLHRALRLLVNRLKALSTEDLQREKMQRAHETQATMLTRAEDVWSQQRGQDADPPLQDLLKRVCRKR